MLINYRETNVHAMGYVTMKSVVLKNKKTGKKRVIQKLDTQAPQDIKWLRPGWNEFPRKVWEQNKTHPEILMLLKKRKIVLMADPVTVTVKDKDGRKRKVTKVIGQDDEELRLDVFNQDRAVEVVRETFNRDMLQRWLDEETRHRVKRALTKQIKPLLNKSKDDDEDDEDKS